MKKIKIFVVLIFFLIISAVSNNVMAAGPKTMVCTDLIHIYNTSTNFDFTVTNNTTLDQIKNAYQSAGTTHMLETDSCFGGHALSIWHDNYTDYLYVETVSNDEYVVSYGSVWNQFQTYEYDYDEVRKAISDLIEISKHYDDMKTVQKMKEIVPEYKSNNSVYEVLDK